MIHEVHITDPSKTPLAWWPKVKVFQNLTKFEFKPGLNVIFAPNGIGKSTLLLALAKLFHCQQGQVPTVTHQSSFNGLPTGMEVQHDGQPVFFFDPNEKVGLFGGAFDDDFFQEGVMSALNKGSSGELIFHNLNKLLEKAMAVSDVAWKAREEASIRKFLAGTIETKGPKTLLLDEPDRSLAIPLQAKLWRGLANLAAGTTKIPAFQIIVASHSPFALAAAKANVIELEPGYVAQCREEIAKLAKPEPRPE